MDCWPVRMMDYRSGHVTSRARFVLFTSFLFGNTIPFLLLSLRIDISLRTLYLARLSRFLFLGLPSLCSYQILSRIRDDHGYRQPTKIRNICLLVDVICWGSTYLSLSRRGFLSLERRPDMDVLLFQYI